METYEIEHHRHLFAQWAAGTAARRGWNTNGKGLKGEDARFVIERAGLPKLIASPEHLTGPPSMDTAHRQWRQVVIGAAREREPELTAGVAAKLINVYFKSAFVCGGFQSTSE